MLFHVTDIDVDVRLIRMTLALGLRRRICTLFWSRPLGDVAMQVHCPWSPFSMVCMVNVPESLTVIRPSEPTREDVFTIRTPSSSIWLSSAGNNHVIWGTGWPTALQSSWIVSPRRTWWLGPKIGRILGGHSPVSCPTGTDCKGWDWRSGGPVLHDIFSCPSKLTLCLLSLVILTNHANVQSQ